VTDADVAAAFASGSSPSNAITILDDTDSSGNPSIDIEDIDLDKMLDVNSAIAVEKEIAADTMGTLFSATRSHFLPYVEQCTLELVPLLSHYYEGIRKSATESLLEIIRTFYELGDPQDWVPGATVVCRAHFVSSPVTGIDPLVFSGRSSQPEREGPHRSHSSGPSGDVRV
jgi:importin-4